MIGAGAPISTIGMAGAFLGGLLALISPCGALLLPSFLAYSFGRGAALVKRTAAFYLGLAAVLVPLGAGVGAIGALLTRHRSTVTLIGGIVIIALGVLIALGGGFTVPGTSRGLGRLSGLGAGSWLSILALGALYGLAGFCAGPLLGAVLTVVAAGGSAGYGALLMGLYALGMTVPLLGLAVVWDSWKIGERRWLKGRPIQLGPVRTHSTSLIAGVIFIAIGVLFITTAGTASIGSVVGVHADFSIQTWISEVARTISDLAVLFVIAAIVLVVLVVRLIRRRSQAQKNVSAP